MFPDSVLDLLSMLNGVTVFLDKGAYDVLAVRLLASGSNSLNIIEEIAADTLNLKDSTAYSCRVAFVTVSPLTTNLLEAISKICSSIALGSTVVFTPVISCENTKYLQEPVGNRKTNEVRSLSYSNERFGTLYLRLVETCPLFRPFVSDIYVLSHLHEFSQKPEHSLGAYHRLNELLWSLKATDDVYSFGKSAFPLASHFATKFAPAFERKDSLREQREAVSAAVIFIGDLDTLDPVACLEPYARPSSFLDLLLAELSSDGHCAFVCWDSLSNLKRDETTQSDLRSSDSFSTDLLQSSDLDPASWLNRYHLLKEQEALIALQTDILNIAQTVQHDLPELARAPQTRIQWASLLQNQVKELFGPVCSSGDIQLLETMQLAMASSLALSSFSARSDESVEPTKTLLEKLLSRFERPLLVACQLDLKSLSQLDEATKCEPILLHAFQEARNLVYLTERFLLVAYLINLLPVQYNVSQTVWSTIENLFTTARRSRDSDPTQVSFRDNLIPTCVTPAVLIANIKRLREERRKLPSYNNVWASQPRYRSPLVQLLSDLITARARPDEASPALKGLEYHPPVSSSAKWLTEISRFIRIPGKSDNSVGCPYAADYVIFVISGVVPFALARELLETVKSHPIKVKIIANRFTGGRAGLSGFLDIL